MKYLFFNAIAAKREREKNIPLINNDKYIQIGARKNMPWILKEK